MRFVIAAALALLAASSLDAQTVATTAPPAAPATDLSYATPVGGSWVYSATGATSEASFVDASNQHQVTIRCLRTTRRVTISKPAAAAASYLWVWTSTGTRNLPASFDPATRLVSAQLANFDAFLDAISFSRGRVGFSVSGAAALIVPPWSEVARVIEDCRS
jgi:hypothetical protein